jgi:hypothetical protein
MSIPSQIQRIKGHTLGQPEQAFIITESERDPKEVNQGLLQDFSQMGIISLVPRPFPQFFNVARRTGGMSGRSGDVMDAVWAVVGLSLPTRPRNILHVEKDAVWAVVGLSPPTCPRNILHVEKDAVWAVVGLSPPTRPRNILHVEKLASTVNSTAAQCTSQSVRV